MKSKTLGLMLVLIGVPLPGNGDLYKYTDTDGRVYFTNEPMEGGNFRLEWKRTPKKLMQIIGKSSKHSLVFGRSKLGILPQKLSARRKQYAALIERTARRFKLYPELLHAVIRAESGYDPTAVSSAGAIGLMQLMPATAARYQVSDSYDPAENIRGGAQYLRFLLDTFEHDLRLALAGYHAGENAVIRHGNRIPPYPATQEYVRKVLQFLWAERATASR